MIWLRYCLYRQFPFKGLSVIHKIYNRLVVPTVFETVDVVIGNCNWGFESLQAYQFWDIGIMASSPPCHGDIQAGSTPVCPANLYGGIK